jgi:GTPase SAR1 family protein
MKRTKHQFRDNIIKIILYNSADYAIEAFTIKRDVCYMVVKTRGDIYSIFLNGTNIKTKNKTQGSAIEKRKEREQKNAPFIPIAKRLAEIVSSHFQIEISNQHIKTWVTEIERLCNIDKVSIDRMETVLDWYEKNIGEQYVPIVRAGPSFRRKFPNLEQAIIRSNKKKPEKFEYHRGIKYRVGDDGRLYHARTGTLYIP